MTSFSTWPKNDLSKNYISSACIEYGLPLACSLLCFPDLPPPHRYQVGPDPVGARVKTVSFPQIVCWKFQTWYLPISMSIQYFYLYMISYICDLWLEQSWPHHYKSMGKYLDASTISQTCTTLEKLSLSWPFCHLSMTRMHLLTIGHVNSQLRSGELIINFC